MNFINKWLHNRNEVYITLMVIVIIIVLSLTVFVNNSFFVQVISCGSLRSSKRAWSGDQYDQRGYLSRK